MFFPFRPYKENMTKRQQDAISLASNVDLRLVWLSSYFMNLCYEVTSNFWKKLCFVTQQGVDNFLLAFD